MFIRYNHEREDGQSLSIVTIFKDIKSGFKYFISIKPIFYLLMGILVFNFFFSPVYSNFVPYFIVSDVTGTDYLLNNIITPELWSSIFSVGIGIGSLVVGFIFSLMKQKEKYNKLIRISFVLVSLTFMVDAFMYFLFIKDIVHINILLITFFMSLIIIGGLIIFINVPASTSMMRMIDKDNFGKVSSVVSIGSQGLIPLSTFLAGLCLTYIGSLGLLFICSLGSLIVSLFIYINKSIKQI
jgi:hypothetical protein